MGLFKGALKTGIAVKLVQFARREAAKPENQRKAKEMIGRITSNPDNRRRAKQVVDKASSRAKKQPGPTQT